MNEFVITEISLSSTYKAKSPTPLFEKHLNNNTFDEKQTEQTFVIINITK
jgi:hypothetical protein